MSTQIYLYSKKSFKKTIFNESNLLLTYKDFVNLAQSKEELKTPERIVMDIDPNLKEIDSDVEVEYRKLWKLREDVKHTNIEEKLQEKNKDMEL